MFNFIFLISDGINVDLRYEDFAVIKRFHLDGLVGSPMTSRLLLPAVAAGAVAEDAAVSAVADAVGRSVAAAGTQADVAAAVRADAQQVPLTASCAAECI